MKPNRKLLSVVLLTIALIVLSTPAMAFEEPAAGSFGYEIYDFVVNDMLGGAIGLVLACLIAGYAIYWILRSNIFGAVACAVAALLLVNIQDVVLSLGMMV